MVWWSLWIPKTLSSLTVNSLETKTYLSASLTAIYSSVMLKFINNTAPSGGAIVFHKQSHMMVNLEKKSEVSFYNNYVQL